MKERDKTIDRLRGMAMLWVILVHVLYWGNFYSNIYINLLKSFSLFEMPLFFFVTGASNSKNQANGYFSFVYRRYKRILVPYWVFAIVCTTLSIVKYSTTSSIDVNTIAKVFFSWLIPANKQITSIPYLTWALWFIPVYLCVILIIPFFKHMRHSRMPIMYGLLLLGVFIATCLFKLGWVQNVAFYSLWTYIGLFYDEIIFNLKKKSFCNFLLFIAAVGIFVLLVFYFMKLTIDMQYNKFPPNITFAVFSFVMMAIIILIIPYINKVYDYLEKNKLINKMLKLFSMRSLTIFLYQVFAFNLTIKISNILVAGSDVVAGTAKAAICLILTVPLCAVLALIFGRIENVGKIKNIAHN